ncbi:MAG: efflux RND transporter periplasmic adaptor subunit [Massilia sp.]
MDQQVKTPNAVKPPVRGGKRAKVIGSIIAVLAMLGLGGLAWYLTHPAAADGGAGGPGGAAAGRGGPGGPGGGGGRGRFGGAATTVGVAKAEKTDIPVVIDALGTVTAAATATVRPQVSGILQKIHFSEGQMVKAGQVLATIDPRPFEMALLQSSGQRQRDEAQLDSARVTLSRYRTLLEQDSIARQDVDTQAALVKQLEGTIMTDRAAEGVAKLNLSYTQIKAPISGRLGLRVVDVGNIVSTGDTAGVAVITQVAPIDVEFAVPQDSVPDLQQRIHESASMPATAFDRTRTVTLDSGKFSALDNQVDVQTGTVRAKARFGNAKLTLFPSQFVNLRLEMRTIKDAVVVPVTALRHGASGDFVYVLNPAERTVALRTVTRGQATVDKVEVKTGLTAGEQVITEGADRLKDGAKVTLPGDKPAGGGNGGGGRRGKRAAAEAGGAAAAGAAAGGAGAVPAAAAPAAVGAAPAPVSPAASAAAAPGAPAAAGADGDHPRRRRGGGEAGGDAAGGAPASGDQPRRQRPPAQ